ncbi:formate/nitrite transporter family protein [Brevirhabdus sp.]|uniref:formate/nitrite transporter family protein n=1 Tax=Brevirhabdus sp. TaxID=2004514 RepID=UPI004058A58C
MSVSERPEHSSAETSQDSDDYPERNFGADQPERKKSDSDQNDKSRKPTLHEEKHVRDAEKLPSRLIYEVIRRNGEAELLRPTRSLFWSGIAAGVMISFSFLTEAVMRRFLPDAPWRPLVESLGYTTGFVLVISGRMQLFTENTITTVLPLVAKQNMHNLICVIRLWTLVLVANLIGTLAAGAFIVYSGSIPDEFSTYLVEIARHAMEPGPWDSFAMAMPAGLLIAALVWILPQFTGAGFLPIILVTWMIAVSGFQHIIAGSVEMSYLIFRGDLGVLDAVFGFFVPVLIGNIVGGTAIFAMMAWGQVVDEVDEESAAELADEGAE